MAEFIHTADWHLGNPFSTLDPDRRRRLAQARFLTAETILLYAKKNRIPLMLCAGDTMDNGQVTREEDLFRLLQIMGKYPEVRIVMIAGNHDPLVPHNVYSRVDRGLYPENVRMVTGDEVIDLPEMDIRIYASSLKAKRGDANPLHWVPSERHDRIAVGLAHGSITNVRFENPSFPIEPDFAISKGLDYLALGDWHSCLKVNERTYYPGTPEPLQFGDSGFPLRVRIGRRGDVPQVEQIGDIQQYTWIEEEMHVSDDQFDAFRKGFESVREKEITRLALSGFLSVEKYKVYRDLVRMHQGRYCGIDDRVCIRPDEETLISLVEGYMKDVISRLTALKNSGDDLAGSLFDGLLTAEAMNADDFTCGITRDEVIDQAILKIYQYFNG